MKILYLLPLFLLISYNINSQSNKAQVYKILNERGEICFNFKADPNEVNSFSEILSIDKYDGKTITAYANKNEFENFLNYNIKFEINENNFSSNKALNMASTIEEMANWNKYPTYEVYVEMMQKFAVDFPEICKLDTIGYSVQNRLLLAVKISDNVNEYETEPEFFYSGQIHGDELISGILFLKLIDFLLNEYETNLQVKNLIDNIQIYINPLSNPDGMYRGGNSDVSMSTRYNSNYIDLNRNFPRMDGVETNIQPEIQAMMDYIDNHNFVMSCNSHSGAEVINYPFDATTTLPADNNWWKFVCREYADNVHENSESGYFDALNNGVTNGAAWYMISGGRQDYMNYYKHCREVTLELSNQKKIDSDLILQFWNNNKNALLDYMQQATYGLRGTVTDSLTGEPLVAKVFINSHDKDNSHVFSFAEFGDYYRFLAEGNYNVSFSANGYISKTFDVTIQNYEQTVLDVKLSKSENNIINNENNSNIVNIYPNPCFDIITLESDYEIYKLSLNNLSGQNLINLYPASQKYELDIKSLSEGIYFLNLEINGKSVQTKIIKQ